MTQLDDTTTGTSEQVTTDQAAGGSDRRSMLRKMAIAGAGATVAAVALNKTAQAADGDPINIGETNVGTLPTILTKDPADAVTEGPSALSVSNAAPGATAPFPANVGGYGNEKYVNGLHGSTTEAAGFGVVAANLAPAAGATDPTTKALAIASTGAHVQFLAGAAAGPAPGTHVPGELYVDADGTLWFTVPTAAGATTARFVKLAATPAAGSYHAINPQRAYDSRIAAYPESGLLPRLTGRNVSVANGHAPNGSVSLENAVPAGATAVMINLTAASPTGPNFLAVTAGNVMTYTASLLNWDAGVTQIANSITVPVDAERRIRVHNGDQAGSTHFIVDVFGYYL